MICIISVKKKFTYLIYLLAQREVTFSRKSKQHFFV